METDEHKDNKNAGDKANKASSSMSTSGLLLSATDEDKEKPKDQKDKDTTPKTTKKVQIRLPEEVRDYEVNTEALDMWLKAKTHRANQQRAHLRADQLQQCLEQDIVPVQYMGAGITWQMMHSDRLTSPCKKQSKLSAMPTKLIPN